ncbi:MAG: NADH-quinone oxidoreductase subunit NuoF [Deltaproteobacteria bacterium]|nr:NADH-quinone oxidoreductase subunit NuoF [Deltaproteobacteria bacterium]
MASRIESLEQLTAIKDRVVEEISRPGLLTLNIGLASCGIAAGAQATADLVQQEMDPAEVLLRRTGCLGDCEAEPLVEILGPDPDAPRILYKHVTPDKVLDLVAAHRQGDFPGKLALGWMADAWSLLAQNYGELPAPAQQWGLPHLSQTPFYAKQFKVALRNCGYIDPENLEHYISRGGYQALWKALREMAPGDIIETMLESGLRGRGGAGFPTGMKWKFMAASPGDQKYVIVNADEGDPGAYMDRSVLEGDPHSVLEGLAIAARATGANQGYIYARHEYPLAVKRLKIAIAQAREHGLLGRNILGSGFDFDVTISTGAGAFVCGEETALMASIMGEPGRPRPRPPFPAQSGLWGKPSNINNVETMANVPAILFKGGGWYKKIGAGHEGGSSGTKVFSLVGKIKNTGLVEVPIGISLREIVFDIGGGVPKKKNFKAVQTGGPSGGCITNEHLDTPVDYHTLGQLGSIMGSGGMIVMDQSTCMVDLARYFIEFLIEESCGKCVPCREGLQLLHEILVRISRGEGLEEDMARLEELALAMKDFSLCGLGQTAPNPVLSTLQYFREEYLAHIRDKHCPAGVCEALYHYRISPEKCTGCHLCALKCPQACITGEKRKPHELNPELCVKCGLCYNSCKFDAIEIV